MKYRLPNVKDEKEIREYLKEHFDNGEKDIIFCQDTLVKDYTEMLDMV